MIVVAYSIKTHEDVISLQNCLQTIPMAKQNSIESDLKADYRFMHIGVVQVAVKPLLMKCVNTNIYGTKRQMFKEIQVFALSYYPHKCLQMTHII